MYYERYHFFTYMFKSLPFYKTRGVGITTRQMFFVIFHECAHVDDLQVDPEKSLYKRTSRVVNIQSHGTIFNEQN